MNWQITRINNEKWYGFISADWKSLFFHATDLPNSFEDFERLSEGDSVSFDIWQSRDGKQKAINVVLH